LGDEAAVAVMPGPRVIKNPEGNMMSPQSMQPQMMSPAPNAAVAQPHAAPYFFFFFFFFFFFCT